MLRLRSILTAGVLIGSSLAYSQEPSPATIAITVERPLQVTAKNPAIRLSLQDRTKPAFWGCSALLRRVPKKKGVIAPTKSIQAIYENHTSPSTGTREARLEKFTLKLIQHPSLDLISCTLYESDPQVSLADPKIVQALLKLSGIEAQIPEQTPLSKAVEVPETSAPETTAVVEPAK